MCVVSMIGDHYRQTWPKRYPWIPQIQPYVAPPTQTITLPSNIRREEFDELKRSVEEMKELLVRAKKYDGDNGEPECELDEKVALLEKVAELVGVSLDDVLG